MNPKRLFAPRRAALLDRLRFIVKRFAHGAAALARAATKPAVVIAAMLAAGGACAVTGVWMLAGTGWAFIAAAAVLFGLAALALRGLTDG